jgi:hypothetical protein
MPSIAAGEGNRIIEGSESTSDVILSNENGESVAILIMLRLNPRNSYVSVVVSVIYVKYDTTTQEVGCYSLFVGRWSLVVGRPLQRYNKKERG